MNKTTNNLSKINKKSPIEEMYESSLKFLNQLTPEEVCSAVISEGVRLSKADYGTIVLILGEDYDGSYSTMPIIEKFKPRKTGVNYEVYESQQIKVLKSKDIKKVHPKLKGLNLKSIVLIPLIYQGNSIGVLNFSSTKRNYFSQKKLYLLKLYASMASLAIRKAYLAKKVSDALNEKDSFLEMMAHEIKTPLTSLKLQIQMLKINNKFSAGDIEVIEKIKKEIQRLSDLSKKLTNIDTIRCEKINYQWRECSIREVANKAVNMFKDKYPDYSIQIRDNLNGYSNIVIGDYERLLEAVNHLLSNASKYSSPEKQILVSLYYKKPNLIISIKDEGKGISKKDLPNIFNRYNKGSMKYRSINDGIGVGLFLSKRIIEKHRGSIRVSSKLNKGSKFEIRLPRLRYD